MGKALMEDLPYPDLSNIGPDMRAARIISPAYAAAGSELTAILQYVYHGLQFGYKNMPELAELMTDIAIAEMRHLDLLGETLLRLGANPIYTACPPIPRCYYSSDYVDYTTVPASILLSDIAGETAAIDGYEKMLALLENDAVSSLISRIILDEKLHLKRLKEAYADLCREQSRS